MKSKLSKIAGASVLALSLATLPAQAQTNTAPGGTVVTPTDNVRTTGTDVIATRDDGFDWGWLGLIGLAGLAGLAGLGGKKRAEPTAYRDPNAVGTNTYRE